MHAWAHNDNNNSDDDDNEDDDDDAAAAADVQAGPTYEMDEPSWGMPGVQLHSPQALSDARNNPWGDGSLPLDGIPAPSSSSQGREVWHSREDQYLGNSQQIPGIPPRAYSQPDLVAPSLEWARGQHKRSTPKQPPTQFDIHASAGAHPGSQHVTGASFHNSIPTDDFQLPSSFSTPIPDLEARIKQQQRQQRQQLARQLQQQPQAAFQGFNHHASGRHGAGQHQGIVHERGMAQPSQRSMAGLPMQGIQLPASSREILRKAYGSSSAGMSRPMIDPAQQVSRHQAYRQPHQSMGHPGQSVPVQSQVRTANMLGGSDHAQQMGRQAHGHVTARPWQSQAVPATANLSRNQPTHASRETREQTISSSHRHLTTSPPVFDCSRALEILPADNAAPAKMAVQHSMPEALPEFQGRPAVSQNAAAHALSHRARSPGIAGAVACLIRMPTCFQSSWQPLTNGSVTADV